MTEIARSAPVKDAPHADALSPGTRLAEFEILSVLGMGGFGVVYKAFDHSLHRAVAIKEYLPLSLAGRDEGLSVSVRTLRDAPAFQSGLKSFVGEARLLAQFDHPSLVKVFRFWEAHNTAYMVMPLYDGMTLKQARAQMRTPPPESWLRQVLWSVLGALRMLHESQTLHRDISPDNIFLQDMGPPVLLDLGAARHAIHDRDHKHTAVLKVNYAPIEQYADGDVDLQQGPWSDLYSLAAVVHGCLCNDTPLPSTLRSIRDRMVPFARVATTVHDQFGQAYSPAFVAAVGQSLALRPEDRPQSIDAFLHTMGMVSPPAPLEYFDFRAELGDIWVEPTDQPGPGLTAPTVDLTNALLGQLSGPSYSRDGDTPAPPAPAPVLADSPAWAASPVAPVLAAPSRPDALPTVAPVLPLPVAHASAPAPVDDTDFVLAPAGAVAIEDAHEAIFLEAGDTIFLEELVDSSTQPSSAPLRQEASAPPQPTCKKPLHRAVWLAAVVVLLGAVLGYGWRARTPAAPPEDTIITEMAEPASGASALVRASEPVSQEEMQAESASPVAPAGPLPAFVEVSSKHPAAASAAPQRRSATASAAPEQVSASSAVSATPAPAPAALIPKPLPEPAKALCADTSFFTRSACVYSECAKPAHAALALCVEHRSRLQKQAESVSSN